MTAARPARDLAATRDKLTAALAEHRPRSGHFCRCGWEGDDIAVHLGDVTSPVVAEAIADELDAAAEDAERWVENAARYLTTVEAGSIDHKTATARRLAYRRSADRLRARAADIREKAGRP